MDEDLEWCLIDLKTNLPVEGTFRVSAMEIVMDIDFDRTKYKLWNVRQNRGASSFDF